MLFLQTRLVLIFCILSFFRTIESVCPEESLIEQKDNEPYQMQERALARRWFLKTEIVRQKKHIMDLKHRELKLRALGIIAPWLKYTNYDIKFKRSLLESELISLEIKIKNNRTDLRILDKELEVSHCSDGMGFCERHYICE